MSATVSLTESDVLKAVRTVLLGWLPDGVEVIRAQDNRVPEPKTPDFVLMTALFRQRLGTNIDGYRDIILTGSIAGKVLTVSAVTRGKLLIGCILTGSGVAARTHIAAQTSGAAGGTGVYQLDRTQSTLSSRTLYAGMLDTLQETEIVMQLDVHGPASAQNAQIISNLWTDDRARLDISRLGVALIGPLYASDPRQLAFVNDQSQYEDRWIVELHTQANITVSLDQQFADEVEVSLIAADTLS